MFEMDSMRNSDSLKEKKADSSTTPQTTTSDAASFINDCLNAASTKDNQENGANANTNNIDNKNHQNNVVSFLNSNESEDAIFINND